MIWILLASHLAAFVALAAIGDKVGRWVFGVAAAPMAALTVWAMDQLTGRAASTAEFVWVEQLDLSIAFRIDGFTTLIAALVSGIGVQVCLYAAGYFSRGTEGLGRFAATLLAFSTAMVGLVLADSVWTLFLFWELTSITSFLLVGHKRLDPIAAAGARRALVITAGGGLALLAAFVLLLDAAPGTRLSDLQPITGGTATAAAILIMLAAATKSAQVPFHVWLPGAMAAPTPVSAYLHSATMVKAGVVLVAVLSPAFVGVAVWKPLGITVGGLSMIWGAIGALRHNDAKLILAWGTVSQLGLMIVLLSLGTAKATFAALAILVAHALSKAALFMVVGEIDVRTGTRDVRELSGLWRSMPYAFAVALVSAASMAGIPPLLGFPAKEAAVEAALKLAGLEYAALLTLIIGGSILTVAYTIRFMLLTFGSGARNGADVMIPVTIVASSRLLLSVPSLSLGITTLLGFAALGTMTVLVRDAATTINEGAVVYSLLRWPGLTLAFLISAAIVVVGSVLGVWTARRPPGQAPESLGANTADFVIDGMISMAGWVTARVQHGSLPAYLLTIMASAIVAVSPFAAAFDLSALYLADGLGQVVLVVLILAVATAAMLVRSRLGAALVLGSVGFAMTGFFIAQGAPDLVLTQLLVETVIVVGFVMGLGRLSKRFPPAGGLWLRARIAVATLMGLAVAVAMVASASGPTGRAPTEEFIRQAIDTGGGYNVVNVILTDLRALDTFAEIMVLLVVAVGILSLTRKQDNDDEVQQP